MKKYPVFKRQIRCSGWGSPRELAIPPEFLDVIGNSVYEWMNENWNIEITNRLNGTKHVKGLFVSRSVRAHGGSKVIVIHYEIINAFRIMGKDLDWVKIFVNERNNLEIQPILR